MSAKATKYVVTLDNGATFNGRATATQFANSWAAEDGSAPAGPMEGARVRSKVDKVENGKYVFRENDLGTITKVDKVSVTYSVTLDADASDPNGCTRGFGARSEFELLEGQPRVESPRGSGLAIQWAASRIGKPCTGCRSEILGRNAAMSSAFGADLTKSLLCIDCYFGQLKEGVRNRKLELEQAQLKFIKFEQQKFYHTADGKSIDVPVKAIMEVMTHAVAAAGAASVPSAIAVLGKVAGSLEISRASEGKSEKTEKYEQDPDSKTVVAIFFDKEHTVSGVGVGAFKWVSHSIRVSGEVYYFQAEDDHTFSHAKELVSTKARKSLALLFSRK